VTRAFLTFSVRILAGLVMAAAAQGASQAEPLTFSAVNVTDVLDNVQGGFAHGAVVMDRGDITVTYLGDDDGIPGLSVFLDVQLASGSDFTGIKVGDVQGVSSLDGPAGVRLANAWAAKDFDGQIGIKAGIVDLNTEFDVQSTAALFLNSAFGIGPDFSQSGLNGPAIFPTTGLGLVGWWLTGGHWQLKAGLFEGIPGNPAHPGRTELSISSDEGALLVAEVRNHLTPDFLIGAGAWAYTASFDAIDPARGRLSGNSGLYAIADGKLYAPDDDSGLSGWIRAGLADDRINPLNFSIGAGLVYDGLFGRAADQAGISVAMAHFGAPARAAALAGGNPLGAAETTIEATYSAVIGDHFIVQPDIQFVTCPSGATTLDNALVIGSRFTVTW
jgi:porin